MARLCRKGYLRFCLGCVICCCGSLFMFLMVAPSLNEEELLRQIQNEGVSSERRRELTEQLAERIVSLSSQYAKLISEKQKERQDHAFAPFETAYSLKKTLAVLIVDVLKRLERLESIVLFRNGSALDNNVTNAMLEKRHQMFLEGSMRMTGLLEEMVLEGKQEKCELPPNWKTFHPNCEEKVKWMQHFWKSDPCYASLGVDGSNCSILIYLSEIEDHCPRLSFRPTKAPDTQILGEQSDPQLQLDNLVGLMTDNPLNYQWIKTRVTRLWPYWVSAYQSLSQKQNWTLHPRRRQKILLHLGFLTKESGFKFGEKSLKGGPLGELVQWSDLISVLYLLGHDLLISSEIKTFVTFAKADPAFKSSCPVLGSNKHVDLIFTDIVGLRQMKKKMPASLQNYRCRLRVLDSFGTQAEFNSMTFFTKHKQELGGSKKNSWGGHALNLQQFYTMFPHSHDNTFLGFVVETPNQMLMNSSQGSSAEVESGATRKKNCSVVYGKESYMWKGMDTYLNDVRAYTKIYGTVSDNKTVPRYVSNLGVLNLQQFHTLLAQCKLFLGLGFPYEGPAPLEAIANGAVFINPRFKVPKSRLTEKFFADKPTLRELKSQNSYAEDFIGPPYVLTVDIGNKSQLVSAITQGLNSQLPPYLPYEFTTEGMTERVNALLEHQSFCEKNANWPPFSAHRLFFAE